MGIEIFRFNDTLVDAVVNGDRHLANEIERRLEQWLDERLVTSPGYQAVPFVGSGTFTKADYPWARTVKVSLVGGGGGSGGCGATSGSQRCESAGGGGAGYSEKTFSIDDLTDTVTVTIGAGGTAGAAGVNSGGTGGTTSFGSYLSATGGVGGAGAAGVASATLGIASRGYRGAGVGGDLNLAGSHGGNGVTWNAQPSFQNWGGAAGGPWGAQAVAVGNYAAAAIAGENVGSGASGGRNTASASARAGAAGSAGYVKIELWP